MVATGSRHVATLRTRLCEVFATTIWSNRLLNYPNTSFILCIALLFLEKNYYIISYHKKEEMDRRNFIKQGSLTSAALIARQHSTSLEKKNFKILNPRNRVPINFNIDDSTALVNLAYFGIPQFKEVFPDKYLQDWRKLPREIPDSFVLEFIEWCDSKGVKGKYSMVPYPACTGWLHRFIPGWSKKELEASLEVVRKYVTPNWDIHSEMISHTRGCRYQNGPTFSKGYTRFYGKLGVEPKEKCRRIR